MANSATATGSQKIEDRVHRRTHVGLARPSTRLRRRNQLRQALPFRIGKIARQTIPGLAITAPVSLPSTSPIILKIADGPLNHPFLNGMLRFKTGSKARIGVPDPRPHDRQPPCDTTAPFKSRAANSLQDQSNKDRDLCGSPPNHPALEIEVRRPRASPQFKRDGQGINAYPGPP